MQPCSAKEFKNREVHHSLSKKDQIFEEKGIITLLRYEDANYQPNCK